MWGRKWEQKCQWKLSKQGEIINGSIGERTERKLTVNVENGIPGIRRECENIRRDTGKNWRGLLKGSDGEYTDDQKQAINDLDCMMEEQKRIRKNSAESFENMMK